uniref:JmjC domain-containing protein n=1 Tax=Bionectria ochroleuca TaxID=29856 RepID=A0A8H7K6M2_BIOOC
MAEQVGAEREFVVHESRTDTERLDFNSKNFQYVTDSFGNIMRRIQQGGRLYLRALSNSKPSERPANIKEDFPALADDFIIPREVALVEENLFSSILRVSGKVNMWLHYDVMANIYAQVRGSKRMVLFPPSDVSSLSFAPGSSSSSIDVFSLLASSSLPKTRPHETNLAAGDVLFIPTAWLHTATPTSDMSVAVNVFFRDLDKSSYSAGRDVYGNRDLAAYERGDRMLLSWERVSRICRKR